jgi:hypothetical protein
MFSHVLGQNVIPPVFASRPTALVICAPDPTGNPRPNRMIRWLAPHFDIAVVSHRREPLAGARLLSLPAPTGHPWVRRIRQATNLTLGRFEARLWPPGMAELLSQARALHPEFIVVHDLALLPFALAVRGPAGGRVRVLFDAREYYTRQFEDRWFWRLFFRRFNKYLAETYLRESDVMVTVNRGLAAEYRREFGVSCGVLPGYPEPVALEPSPLDPGRVRMIHHGIASPSRRLESMIAMMDHLPPSFSLDLMLLPSDRTYVRKLEAMCSRRSNVRIVPPVPFREIIPTTNNYDVGVFLVPPVNFNLRHALPNKFFEFIQARLAVAIGPSTEMAPYVHEFDCGVVADDFTPHSLAEQLARLTNRDLVRLKANSHRAASELTSERTRAQLLAVALERRGVEVFA